MNNVRESATESPMLDQGRQINLSIVVPAYNEGHNVAIVVEQSIQTLSENAWVGPYELVLIDDGSTDDTGQIANNLARQYEGSVRVIHHPTNQGLGAALKTGYGHAQGRYVTMIPGDGEVGLDQALKLFRDIADADLMLSRRQRAVQSHRTVLTGVFRLLMRLIVGAQTSGMEGIYVIRREVLQSLHLQSNTGLVNLELVMQCQAKGCAIKAGVMDVRPRLSGQSKVTNLSTILRTLWELFKLRFALLKEGRRSRNLR